MNFDHYERISRIRTVRRDRCRARKISGSINEVVSFTCPECPVCGKPSLIDLAVGYVYVIKNQPYKLKDMLPAHLCEFLLLGIHPACRENQ